MSENHTEPMSFLSWSRRRIFALLIVSIVPVLLYQLAGFKGLSLPWSVVLLFGTTVALVAGFKNTQTYSRNIEAQQAWSGHIGEQPDLRPSRVRFPADRGGIKVRLSPHRLARGFAFRVEEPRPWETNSKKRMLNSGGAIT